MHIGRRAHITDMDRMMDRYIARRAAEIGALHGTESLDHERPLRMRHLSTVSTSQ